MKTSAMMRKHVRDPAYAGSMTYELHSELPSFPLIIFGRRAA